MIDGTLNQQTTYELPREYTPENVIYWESTSKELRMQGRVGMALLNKARKFLQTSCIDQINNTTWICKSIKGYNKTEYLISSTTEDLACECQGYRKKKKDFDEGESNIKPICSHILAVKQYCFLQEKKK